MAVQNLTVSFTKEEHALVRRAADKAGKSLHQFIIDAAVIRARHEVSE